MSNFEKVEKWLRIIVYSPTDSELHVGFFWMEIVDEVLASVLKPAKLL